jgi:tRNA(fMet)-specific endonuclease VapC
MNAAGSVLLDTNVVVAHFRGDSDLTLRLAAASALYLPWVVAGELHYGAYRAGRRKEALAQVLNFQSITILLLPDEHTAEYYGLIKAGLAQSGTPIPDNDIWIAALAREYQLPVATRDRHFELVAGLTTLAW